MRGLAKQSAIRRKSLKFI
jgi:hypothetical protein